MQVFQTLESVKIQTNNSNLFKQARSLIYKNFRKNIGKKAKLISFCDENELVQRRYFLKWLNCLNRKLNHEDLQLEKSIYKDIYLSLRQEAALKSTVQAKISFGQNCVQIVFSHLDELLAKYLKNFFKGHIIKRLKNAIVIGYEGEQTFDLLEKLASKNEHINRFISFSLDELEFLRFKSAVQNRAKLNSRFLSLCSLYEEQFRTLNLKLGASFSEYKARYRELARKYHPDYHSHESEQVRKLCAQKFAAINQAYELLKPLYLEHA